MKFTVKRQALVRTIELLVGESPALKRVARSGFALRKIQASRSCIPSNRRPRKSMPTTLKTLGDHIQVRRFEEGLLQSELAEKMGVTTSLIQLWENDDCLPDERQFKMLVSLLAPKRRPKFGNPTVDRLLGFAHSAGKVGRCSTRFALLRQ